MMRRRWSGVPRTITSVRHKRRGVRRDRADARRSADDEELHRFTFHRFAVSRSLQPDPVRTARADSTLPAMSERAAASLYLDLLSGASPVSCSSTKRCARRPRRVAWRAMPSSWSFASDMVGDCPSVRRRHGAGRVVTGRRRPSDGGPTTGERALVRRDRCTKGSTGDFAECGGGAWVVVAAGVLAADGRDRPDAVWVLTRPRVYPVPDVDRFPEDKGYDRSYVGALKVGLDDVEANLARYGLLDSQVQLLPGWFEDTLPSADRPTRVKPRIDGDLYQSTMDALVCARTAGGAGRVRDHRRTITAGSPAGRPSTTTAPATTSLRA